MEKINLKFFEEKISLEKKKSHLMDVKKRCYVHDLEYTAQTFIGDTIGSDGYYREAVGICPICLAKKRMETLPRRYLGVDFDCFKVDGAEKEKSLKKYALSKSMAYVERFHEEVMKESNLIFVGGCGTGKTMLACCIARNLIASGVDVCYDSISRICEKLKKDFSEKTNKINLQYYYEIDLLILDEIDVARTEFDKDVLERIIMARSDNKLRIIVISNLDSQGLSRFLGEKAWSRLRNRFSPIINFSWEDLRIFKEK